MVIDHWAKKILCPHANLIKALLRLTSQAQKPKVSEKISKLS